jgi:hypothetical protein
MRSGPSDMSRCYFDLVSVVGKDVDVANSRARRLSSSGHKNGR